MHLKERLNMIDFSAYYGMIFAALAYANPQTFQVAYQIGQQQAQPLVYNLAFASALGGSPFAAISDAVSFANSPIIDYNGQCVVFC
ncbi:MAG: hypothetical protein ACRESZ_04250 [Methylococcales bacterium]